VTLFFTPVDPSSIIWADVSAGALEYYLGKYSASLAGATANVQQKIIDPVAADGRTQYFIADTAERTRIFESRTA